VSALCTVQTFEEAHRSRKSETHDVGSGHRDTASARLDEF